MDRMDYVIYALLDPDTRDVRYIGVTTQPGGRRTAHENCKSAVLGSPLAEWMAELTAAGKRPVFKVHTRISGCGAAMAARAAEKLFIEHYSRQQDGHLILNIVHNKRRYPASVASRRPRRDRIKPQSAAVAGV